MAESREEIHRLLASVNVDANRLPIGKNKLALCPKCSHARRTENKKVRCLSIMADADGFLYNCHNCGWSGGSKTGHNGKAANGASQGKPIRPSKEDRARANAAVAAALNTPTTEPEPDRKLIETFIYRDADGTVLSYKDKFSSKPKYMQRAVNGAKNLDGVKRVLYRLPELIDDPTAVAFICEGEKDADRVATLGLCATSSDNGTWEPDLVEPLRGRDVIIVPDFDKAGVKRADEVAAALHGVAASIKWKFLPGLDGAKGNNDASDWLDQDPARANVFAETCLAAPVWKPGDKVEGREAAAAVNAKADNDVADKVQEPLQPLPYIDIAKWRVVEAPEREWTIRDLIPKRNVFLLSGEGAAGKTLLMLQLGIAHALGRDWIGTLPEPGPFLYFGAEDESDELYRRAADILKNYGVDFPDLEHHMRLLSYAGEDALLATVNKAGIVTPTELYGRLLKDAIEIKPAMIGIDTVADVFGGSEIDRSQVRQFVGLLRRIAIRANTTVIINAHPSLSGISSGSGLSGSTGWHNSVRARAYLTTIKTDDDDEPDPNLRKLEFKKNNYGPIARSIPLRWENGVFKPVASLDTFDKMALEHRADTVFLKLLVRFNSQKRNVSPNPGPTFAPTIFLKEPEAKGLKSDALKGAMSRLFDSNQIHVDVTGPPSHRRHYLVIGQQS